MNITYEESPEDVEEFLREMNQEHFRHYKTGDIIELKRDGRSHFMIAAEDGLLSHTGILAYHVAGLEATPIFDSLKAFEQGEIRAEVRKERVDCSDNEISAKVSNSLDSYKSPYDVEDIILRAESRLGHWNYEVNAHNDDHFVTWCRYGIACSVNTAGITEIGEVTVYQPFTKTETSIGTFTGPCATVGVSHGTFKGVTVEEKLVGYENDFATVDVGVGLTTGVEAGSGDVGLKVLGTGFKVGEHGLSLSLFGTSVGIKNPFT